MGTPDVYSNVVLCSMAELPLYRLIAFHLSTFLTFSLPHHLTQASRLRENSLVFPGTWAFCLATMAGVVIWIHGRGPV